MFKTSKIAVIRRRVVHRDARQRLITDKASYRACWQASGRTTVIKNNPVDGVEPVIAFRASGDWLLYEAEGGSPMVAKAGGVIASVNVRSGRRGPLVRQTAGVAPGAS